MTRKSLIIAAIAALAVPAVAQVAQVAMPGSAIPGAPDASRVVAGAYKVDTNHTQVVWTLNHLGITPLTGYFGASGGTLQLDPAKPNDAKVSVDFNIAATTTHMQAFTTHMLSADIMDAGKYPTASFVSTSVAASGASAKITGNLTLHGVTKPVTLDAKFYGAGTNPNSKRQNVGFTARTTIKRSDFGINYSPVVGNDVDLAINAAFDKQP